jgi:hypothetical protein
MDKNTVRLIHPGFSEAQVDKFLQLHEAAKPIVDAAAPITPDLRSYLLTTLNETITTIVKHHK